MTHKNHSDWFENSGLPEDTIEQLKHAPRLCGIDLMLMRTAQDALRHAGMSALLFLEKQPNTPLLRLAQILRRRCSAYGLSLAVLHEASNARVLRDVARDLLVRQIFQSFPNGWEKGLGGAVLVGWLTELKSVADVDYAGKILKEMYISNEPASGWLPNGANDPRVVDLFDRNWPKDAAL